MRHLLYLSFLFLSIYSSLAQNNTKGILYLHDQDESYTHTTITSSTHFSPLQEDINNGLKNGIYWFKILPNEVSNKKLIIPNTHVLKGKVYLKNANILLLPLKNEPYLTFNIPKVHQPIYLKIIAEREAYIPIRIQKETHFLNHKFKRFFLNGIYYGFIFMLFILNIFYFRTFKETNFFYYLFFVILVNIGFFFTDGTLNTLFNNTLYFKKIELFDHCLVAVTACYAAAIYLELDFYIPKNKRNNMPLLLLLFFFYGMYFFSDQFIFYVIVESIVFVMLGIYLFYGFFLYKKNQFAKYFCWAYTVFFFMGVEYCVARSLGINTFDISTKHVKIGGVIEMLLITYVVAYRMQTLKKENKLIRQAILEYIKEIKLLKKEETFKIEDEFSKQEIEIIEAISTGLSNSEISEKMNITVNTVKYHIKKIYNKLQVNSRIEIQNKELNFLKKK